MGKYVIKDSGFHIIRNFFLVPKETKKTTGMTFRNGRHVIIRFIKTNEDYTGY